LPTSGNIDADIATEITNILSSVGIPRSIKGFSFLREAIVLSVNNEDYIKKITKKLYPEIAKKFNETPHRVERAIRWAIETAFSRIDFSVSNTLNKLFPASGEKFKVTNSEFIATIADDIRLRRRRESV
jgi:two-component system response regulator (stage 0 sporulation protein A)